MFQHSQRLRLFGERREILNRLSGFNMLTRKISGLLPGMDDAVSAESCFSRDHGSLADERNACVEMFGILRVGRVFVIADADNSAWLNSDTLVKDGKVDCGSFTYYAVVGEDGIFNYRIFGDFDSRREDRVDHGALNAAAC